MSEGGIWRWNSDPAWHYHCSMLFEAVMAREANNDFMRYHHVRACIYFAVSALEAFLNSEMRRYLEGQNLTEESIQRRLRHATIDEKRKKWPTEMCEKSVDLPEYIEKIFSYHKVLRDEITHPKKKDHSVYIDLEQSDLNSLSDAISLSFVKIYEAKSKPFPYWILGWNYVGMNRNPAYPCQLNNMNGFYWSLLYMGFKMDRNQSTWEKKYMSSVDNYHLVKNALCEYPNDIEPYNQFFPTRPRLTRRWWDHAFIHRDLEASTRGNHH